MTASDDKAGGKQTDSVGRTIFVDEVVVTPGGDGSG